MFRRHLQCKLGGTLLTGSRSRPRQQNLLFSTGLIAVKPESVRVDVGSKGSVRLDIYHPPRPAHIHPIILYLARGPVALYLDKSSATDHETTEPVHALSTLATTANATVVHVQYRFDELKQRWPTPLHDVMAGYDWVAQHLASSEAGQSAIGVCGELVGGGLAGALALTEGRRLVEDGPHVRAAVLGNPITDWTAMYRVTKPKIIPGEPIAKRTRGRKSTKGPSWERYAFSDGLSADTLLHARNTLFTSPQHCFDPFASPLLFLRAPGVEVPSPSRVVDPLDALLAEIDGTAAPSTLSSVDKRRRVHRKYPPADSDLILPHTRIWIGEECVLKDQGIELAKSIDRNVGTQRTAGIDEERAAVHVEPGLGLWGNSELAKIGSWFGNILWHEEKF